MIDDHHWGGKTPSLKKYFGFIYCITDLVTGRKYIGKKQYWKKKYKRGCKSVITDVRSDKWKPCCWVESDWHYYKGSSPSLTKWMKDNPDHDFVYVIIRQCRSKGDLYYSELKELWKRDVLAKWDEAEQNYVYFNRQIQGIKFRKPRFKS